MKNYMLIIALLLSGLSFGQKLKVIGVNEDYFHHDKVEGFHCLYDRMPDYGYTWIGTLKIELDTIVQHTIKEIYSMAQDRANRLGANAFRVKKDDLFSYGEEKYITFDIFHLRMENRDENRDLFKGKTLYLFGFLGHHQNMDGYTIKLNGEKMLLTELSYYQFEPKIGDVICLEIGSSAKKDKIEYKVDGKGWPRYFSFQMFHGLFSAHEISEYEWAYGEFLIQVLEKKPTGDRSLSNY